MRKYLDANIIENTDDMPKDEWLRKRKCGIIKEACWDNMPLLLLKKI